MNDPSRSRYLGLMCSRCGAEFEDGSPLYEGCPRCRDDEWATNLIPTYDLRGAADEWRSLSGRGVWRYASFLPLRDGSTQVSLGEGSTPLVPFHEIGSQSESVWLKNEAANPTWSYKDRLNTVAVSKGLELGASVIAASSTGNHGASAAAYAAGAGIKSVILTREDVDRLTTAFMQIYGATVLRTTRRGRWTLLRHGVATLGWYPVSTYTAAPTGNPYGVDGYKTIAFEVFEELGMVPDVVIVPTAYGEGLSGIWSGFEVLRDIGLAESVPRMVAAEVRNIGPLANALERSLERVAEVEASVTVATSIGSTVATDRALQTLRRSRGTSVRVADAEILAAQQAAAMRGIFLEPAGAAGLAALSHLPEALVDLPPAPVVVVIGTAGGLRQVAALANNLPEVPIVEPDPRALASYVRT